MTTAANAAPAWRTFSFFHAQTVSARLEPGTTPEVFKSAPEISTITAGQGVVVVADIHGQVHVCNPDFDVTKSWIAHNNGRVTHMKLAGAKGVLVTIGEEEASPHPVLKVWNIRHDDKKTGTPRLLASGRIQHTTSNRSHPVSTFAMTASLSLIAVAYADGSVLILRQLDQYIQSASSSAFTSANAANNPSGLPKPKLVHSSPSDPVTGLGFHIATAGTSAYRNTITNPVSRQNAQPASGANALTGNVTLFIVTTHQILTYSMTPTGKALSGHSAHATVMDDVGASLGCTTMLSSGEMVLAKDEAIFVYGTEGRGQSYFYEGSKSAVTSYMNYIIITSPPFMPSASSQSATVRNFVRDQRSAAAVPSYDTSADISKVTIFDPQNKYVAYSGAFTEGVREVFCEWGDVFVLTNDSKLHRLVERPTMEKLGVLFSKNLYLLAVGLARSSGLEESEIAEIYRKYGDHLYSKGDFDGAMQQFIKTIGGVQPSYVIRKFLDGQRINNLTSYLQELHEQGVANSDITTLLLNCYAKLKDTERLDAFIKASSPRPNGELPFDLETAINVCRQAGYFEHAVYLAKTYNQPEEYLRIQIEDREEWKDAVEYIRTLGLQAAEANLKKYGKTLLANLPEDTTDLLIDLCCGTLDRPIKSETIPEQDLTGKPTKSSYLSYLALNKSASPAPARSQSVDRSAAASPAPTGEARIKRDRQASTLTVTDGDSKKASDADVSSPRKEPLPEIRQFFVHFIDRPAQFIRFLETLAERRWSDESEEGYQVDGSSNAVPASAHLSKDLNQQREQEAIWNTLIELYLSQANSADTSEADKQSLRSKALKLLRETDDEKPLDLTQALLVCTTSDFTPGVLVIYERLEMYEDILRFWMNQGESPSASTTPDEDGSKLSPWQRIMNALDKYGPEHHELYPLVLRYLTSSSASLSAHQDDLMRILDYVSKEKIMPPIAVVQALSKSGVATVGMVKDYLRKQIVSEEEEMDADRSLTESYRADLGRKEQEIKELSDPNTPRIFQVTRCSACGGSLDLPAVHFMCRHSYHQRCLADNEASCPTCAASQGVVKEIRANNESLRDRHDLFLQELEEDSMDGGDRFETIVQAFSRGLLRPSEE
ncbi:hypothetical protein P389DRAFT_76246 [Cystobasidium minutum MCA 4210]|uniref:uncharacterized protein n=1 Tax=Cystobasidium minutum MCA 4210 TaxID=1397322 RepID=UPI0034CD394C|eukprot:jgi/Rhomi1/76246/CE76245_1240